MIDYRTLKRADEPVDTKFGAYEATTLGPKPGYDALKEFDEITLAEELALRGFDVSIHQPTPTQIERRLKKS